MAVLAGTSACQDASTTANQEGTPTVVDPGQHSTAADNATTAQQMAYVCPMECPGSASMEPGECPVCGMELVKNPDYTASADSTKAP